MGNYVMRIDACCTIGLASNFEESAQDLIRKMDSVDVDMAVIHPADYFYAWENENGNQMFLDLSNKFKDRLIPTMTVNPWRPDAVEIVLKYVEMGARMLSFSPGVQGFNVSGNKLDQLIEAMMTKNLNLPVYVHTGHHSNATPAQLLLLAERFKEITFICGHSGSTDNKPEAVLCCKQVDNFYLESSFARPSLFAAVIPDIGADKAIMGSGDPCNQFVFEWQEMNGLLGEEAKASVLGGNIKKLIGLS
jgi:predicted TIM-barrel fold metal-dependent hydrolase